MKAPSPLSKYVYLGEALRLMAQRDAKGNPVEFDMCYCKMSTGELVEYRGCVLTSRHSLGNTVNIMPRYRIVDGERELMPHRPRKFRIILITHYNHKIII